MIGGGDDDDDFDDDGIFSGSISSGAVALANPKAVHSKLQTGHIKQIVNLLS